MDQRIMRLLQMVNHVMTKGLFHQEHVRLGSVYWEQSRRSRRVDTVAFIHLRGLSEYWHLWFRR
jgi:hypothetical protein